MYFNATTNSTGTTFAFTLSESVQAFTATAFAFTNNLSCSTKTLSGSGTSYTLTIANCTTGTSGSVTLSANSIRDIAGNYALATASTRIITVDTVAPTASYTTKPGSYSNVATQHYTITFSEAVTGMASNKIVIVGSGCQIANYTVTSTSVYDFDVTGCTSGVTSTVTLAANAGSDAAGNSGPSTTVANSTVVDTVAPTVSTWSTTMNAKTNASPMTYSLVFSEPIDPITLTAAAFTIVGCSSTPTFTSANNQTFTVTLAGCTDGTVTIKLRSGTIADPAGNTGPASDTVVISRILDTVAPTASWGSNPTTPTNQASSFQVNFSESVSGFTSSSLRNAGTAGSCVFTVSTISAGFQYAVTVTSCKQCYRWSWKYWPCNKPVIGSTCGTNSSRHICADCNIHY
jgi:hypothetical protein